MLFQLAPARMLPDSTLPAFDVVSEAVVASVAGRPPVIAPVVSPVGEPIVESVVACVNAPIFPVVLPTKFPVSAVLTVDKPPTFDVSA